MLMPKEPCAPGMCYIYIYRLLIIQILIIVIIFYFMRINAWLRTHAYLSCPSGGYIITVHGYV